MRDDRRWSGARARPPWPRGRVLLGSAACSRSCFWRQRPSNTPARSRRASCRPSNTFLATYFTLTGLHALHVVAGLVANLWVVAGARRVGDGMTAGPRRARSRSTGRSWTSSGRDLRAVLLVMTRVRWPRSRSRRSPPGRLLGASACGVSRLLSGRGRTGDRRRPRRRGRAVRRDEHGARRACGVRPRFVVRLRAEALRGARDRVATGRTEARNIDDAASAARRIRARRQHRRRA